MDLFAQYQDNVNAWGYQGRDVVQMVEHSLVKVRII